MSKKGEDDYTYTPQTDWSNGTYQITLTVRDQANNDKSSEYEVTIDTSAVATPEIILDSNDSFEQKKNITKSKNPNFKLKKIAENAQSEIQISVFSVNPKSSSTELGSKKITKTDAIEGFNLNSLTKDSKDVEIQNDGKYQIQAVVTSTAGSKSAPGSLDFTIDSADAPAPTIELVGNTGTDGNPVTNKTQPKLILKNIDSSRLDSDNPELIKVTFLKKGEPDNNKKTQNFKYSQMQKKTKGSDDSTEIEYELTWNQESLEPGEYTVTAKVTYQAGQVGSGQLNNGDVMTIYTEKPQSTIKFLEELDLGKVDGQFKVSKSQMKFQIVPNEKDVPPGRGTTSVQVILKDLEGNQQKTPQTAIPNEGIWTADLSEPDQISKGGKYQVVAKVTDPHGNEGLSQPLSFELLDGLNPPVIKINAEDHTPYDQNEDPNIKITSKRTPQFTFDEIDDVVNKVTVSVSKSKEKNADPKTIKYTKIPEGKWKNDEDDQGYNSNQIPILFQEDGEYNMTLKAETTGGLEATSNRLTLGVYAGVMAPSIAVEGKDELEEVLSGTATPTFEIKKVDPHAREIHITATPIKPTGKQAQKFKVVLNKNGAIKTNSDNGVFEKIDGTAGYRFTPNEGWNEGKYNIVVSVINEARQPSSDSSSLALVIDTSTPAQPSITLSDASNNTHPKSLQEKWTSSRKPTFTIDLKDNNTDNPIEKVEVMVKGVGNKTYIAEKNNSTNQFVTDSPSQKGAFSLESNKKLTFTPDDEWGKGEYSLSVKTYNSLNKPGDVSETEVVNVNDDQPDRPKIELAYADQTGKTIDKSNTKITNNPNPSFAISNINLKQDNIDERAVTITITKDGESKITGAKVTHDTGQFSYKTSNFKDTYGDGEYNATVRVINKAGIPSDSQEFTFEIDTTEPDKPEINWNSEAFKTAKNSDELKAVAKKGQIVFLVTTSEEIDDPRYITAKINNTGSLSAKEKVKDSKNVWKLTSNDSLSSGKHNLYVEVTDKAGNKTSAQGEFMVLNELPAPKIDMAHNTNAEGKTSTPYMINKANMGKADKRKLNISLDDNTLFPYVEMKAELMKSEGSSAELSIKKNHDNNWTVEIPERQADDQYTLKVTATDVLKMTQKTEVGFEVDTTLTNIPVIELKDSGTKSSDSTDAQETTQTKPVFMIRNIPEDIYKINIQISGDNNDYEIKNLEGFKGDSKEWGGIKKDLEDDKKYSITVTFTDKAGNTSNNGDVPYQIKKIAPFVFKDPELILDPETDSGTQGDFKTNHNQPVLLFKNMSDTAVTALKIALKTEGKSKRAYTYFLKKEDSKDQEGNQYTIALIKENSLQRKDLFPEGKYEVTLELTYDNNETYQKKTTLNDPLIINRHKPSAVSDVTYSFNETDGVKTINITGKKQKIQIFLFNLMGKLR